MKCRDCKGEIMLVVRCAEVFLRCKACGKSYPLSEYLDEIDDNMWSIISLRPSNRV